MRRLVRQFLGDEAGQDLIEYALLAGFVSLVATAAIASIGTQVNGWYVGYGDQIKTIPGGS